MRHKWNNSIKEKAISLRKNGYSYGQLVKELGVAKSTLHQWVRGLTRPTKFSKMDRLRWFKEIQPMGAMANRKKKDQMLKTIDEEVRYEVLQIKLNIDMKKIITSMLYWAEGGKTGGTVQFTNTDPKLMKLFLYLLRECYEIDEGKLRIRLHLHYYHKIRIVKKFWSQLLDIPLQQFYKTFIKKRSKGRRFRKNFGGICALRYNSTYLKERILRYGYVLFENIVK